MGVLHQHASAFVGTLVALSISLSLAGEFAPDIDDLRARRPGVLVPGSTTPVLDVDPAGYYVCTLVTRYFEDEKLADLRAELDLTARQQFVRFMAAGRNADAGLACMEVRGFRSLSMWWEDDSLHGVYFVPLDGVGPIDTEPAMALTQENDKTQEPSAAVLLLEARTLRKQREFQAARDTIERLRQRFPASPETRRALRELYFVNQAESRIRAGKDGE